MVEAGRLLQALTNAVLALYGEEEPHATESIDAIVGRLNALAAEERAR